MYERHFKSYKDHLPTLLTTTKDEYDKTLF